MEAPVCLIENRDDGTLQVNPVAASILSSIEQPVVVVGIVGMYRTGKSYLMNKLAKAHRGELRGQAQRYFVINTLHTV